MLSRLLDLLAPPECPACRLAVARLRAFCPACAATIRRPEGRPRLDLELQAAFLYGGALSTAIVRWKFEDALGVGRRLCDLFAAELRESIPPGALLVPVPLHPRRLAERGFNPAALLARRLSRVTGARFAPELLLRLRDTPKQSRLGRGQRADNVAAAFVARAPGPASIVLVDDVCTTGSTLRACQVALAAAGAGPTSAAVLALAGAADT